jgi:hypothetical protein
MSGWVSADGCWITGGWGCVGVGGGGGRMVVLSRGTVFVKANLVYYSMCHFRGDGRLSTGREMGG